MEEGKKANYQYRYHHLRFYPKINQIQKKIHAGRISEKQKQKANLVRAKDEQQKEKF